MKKILLIHVGLLVLTRVFSQSIDPHIDLGEGVVTIVEYAFPPPPERPATEKLAPQAILNYSGFQSFTYYIKKNKILLKAQDTSERETTSSSDTTKSGNGGKMMVSLSARYVHPTYLIDCIKRKTYYFSDSTNKLVENTLEETSTEPFYRAINILQQTTIVSLSDTIGTLIAGKKCYKGVARDDAGKIFTFYYCKEQLGVRSPLNTIFSATFPYNFLRYDLPIKWSYMNGTVSQDGLLIFQVSEIKACSIPDSVMIPPKNLLPVN
jgi:hypothetical protein